MRRVLAVGFCLLVAGAVRAESPLVGTWQADPEVMSVRLSHGAFHCYFCSPVLSIPADGLDQPAPRTGFETMRATVIDARTVSFVAKLKRDPVVVFLMTASEDGTSLTVQRRIAKPGEKPLETTETLTRLDERLPNAHAISGRWSRPFEEDFTSFQIDGDTLVRKDSQGSSYSAKLDGTDAPYFGRPGMSVSVKLTNERTLEQKDKQDGKVFLVERLRVERDGTLSIRYKYTNGNVIRQTAHRIERKP